MLEHLSGRQNPLGNQGFILIFVYCYIFVPMQSKMYTRIKQVLFVLFFSFFTPSLSAQEELIFMNDVVDGKVREKEAEYVENIPGAFIFTIREEDRLNMHMHRDEHLSIYYIGNSYSILTESKRLRVVSYCTSKDGRYDETFTNKPYDSYIVTIDGRLYCIKGIDVINNELLDNVNGVKRDSLPNNVSQEDKQDKASRDGLDESIPFQIVEVMPSFRGGDTNTFSKWVGQKLQYPKIAKENGVQGRVTLQFTINKNGKIDNVKVLRGIDPALDREAVRVVSSSPKWKPGKKGGKPVDVTYTFPVIFQLR